MNWYKNLKMYLREGKYVNAKDLYLLSLAETVHADYILTGDKDLLVLRAHLQTRILTYSEFSSL